MCITAFLTTGNDDILPYLSKPKLWYSALQDASGYKENSKPFNLHTNTCLILIFLLHICPFQSPAMIQKWLGRGVCGGKSQARHFSFKVAF